MKVLKNNNVTAFDVDNTLIMWEEEGDISLEYGKEDKTFREHKFHPGFLRHCSERGDLIIVWSQ